MKHIIVYHSADADGWMSRAVIENEVSKKHGENFTSVGWDFGQPFPQLSPAELSRARMIVVDLPPDPVYDMIPFVDEFWWIDHHKSAIEANSNILYRGLRNVNLSSCRLAWALYNMPVDENLDKYSDRRMPGEPELVFLIGLRDAWKHKDTQFQDICQNINLALIADRTFPFRESLQMSPEAHVLCVDALVKQGAILDKFSKSMNREASERGAFVKQLWGMNVLCLNSQLRGSELLEPTAFDLQRSGESVDAMCVFSLNKIGKFNFSLYHAPGQKHRDLTEIARMFGGGGHSGACGFMATWQQTKQLFA